MIRKFNQGNGCESCIYLELSQTTHCSDHDRNCSLGPVIKRQSRRRTVHLKTYFCHENRSKKKKKSLCEYIDNYLANCIFKNIFFNFFFETIFIARIDSKTKKKHFSQPKWKIHLRSPTQIFILSSNQQICSR